MTCITTKQKLEGKYYTLELKNKEITLYSEDKKELWVYTIPEEEWPFLLEGNMYLMDAIREQGGEIGDERNWALWKMFNTLYPLTSPIGWTTIYPLNICSKESIRAASIVNVLYHENKGEKK